MTKRRVVVTGMGVVSPLGNDLETTWQAVKNGQSGIGPLTRIDTSQLPVSVAAEVKDFNVEQYISKKDARRMDRFTHYAIAAASMAVEHANLTIDESNANRIGVWLGSGIGGMETFEEQHNNLLNKGPRRVSPFFVPMMIPDMAAGQVSIHLGAKGINTCTVTACATGTNSIGDAFKVIQRGDAEVMITGGAEAPITPLAVAGFCSNTALSLNPDPNTASRPFDKERDGFVMGEGAGVIVLEDYEFAKKRGANILAEIIGYGASGDAYHITAPAPGGEGAARAMQQAIDDAGISATQIDYINAHGTSTYYNDMLETEAIKKVFKEAAKSVAISSTKSVTGHMLGAAGGAEAIFAIQAIRESIIPPTMNLHTPAEECDLDYVPNEAREAQLTYVLSNSFGFGGHNATIIFKKFEA